MIELIQMAEQRRDLIKNKLAGLEAEIEALQAELGKLDTFVDLGNELFQGDTPAARNAADTVHARQEREQLPDTPAPRAMPARPQKLT